MGGTPPIIKTQAPAPTRGSFGASDDYEPNKVKKKPMKPDTSTKDLKIKPKSRQGTGTGVKY